ncbi:unnamed protein product [Lepidochelys olivacea]
MKGAALCCWASLLLLIPQGPAGGHPLPRKHTSQELQALQDLLELLKEKTQGEEGELLELENLDYGAEDDDPSWDLAEPESSPATQLQPRDPVEAVTGRGDREAESRASHQPPTNFWSLFWADW